MIIDHAVVKIMLIVFFLKEYSYPSGVFRMQDQEINEYYVV